MCENKDFCNIIVPSEQKKILEFNQYQKSDKADLECIIEKMDVKIILEIHLHQK